LPPLLSLCTVPAMPHFSPTTFDRGGAGGFQRFQDLMQDRVREILLVSSIYESFILEEDGRLDEWNASALQAAEMAQKGWMRVAANMSLGAYEVYQATGDIPSPDWPEMDFGEILKVAFKGHYITEEDHPVIRRLRGEI